MAPWDKGKGWQKGKGKGDNWQTWAFLGQSWALGEYKAFLLAKSMAEDDEKIRKQALMFADAMKSPLEKLASKMSASSGDKSMACGDTPPALNCSQSSREFDKGISKHQAAWVEALFGFAFDITSGTGWDQVTSTLANHLEETSTDQKNLENGKALGRFLDRQSPRPMTPKTGRAKAELLVSIIKE